jgi:2-dehydropantoate 2-reductase
VRLLVYGAGAIGTYIGGSLAAAGHTVRFLARPAAADAIRASGLCLQSSGSSTHIGNISVATSPGEAFASGPHDFVLFALKSYDTTQALAELRAVTTTPPPIVCLQNGVDNEPDMRRVFDADRVIAGTVTTAVTRAGAGKVVVERLRGVGVALKPLPSTGIADAMRGAGLRVRTYPAPEPMKWSKLLVNLVGNATSAILDMPVPEIFMDQRLFGVEVAALHECLAVMGALKVEVVDLPGTPVRALALGVRLPAVLARPLLRRGVSAGRGSKMPSLHIDLHSGRGKTEVRWLNGAVARHGAECGVPTPVNRVLTETLEGLSQGTLSKDAFRRQPRALLRLIND